MLDLAAHRAARLAALTAPDGWLNLTDRVPLLPGSVTVGQGAQNDVVLSVGPARLGRLSLGPDLAATLTPPHGVALPFLPHPDSPPRLALAGLLLELHVVEGEAALRVRQIDHPARHGFAGLRYFPTRPEWVLSARWHALELPETLGIAQKGGPEGQVQITHRAEFSHAGAEVRLLATHWKGGKPMFVFRDATSGQQTYAASRFLIGEDAGDGRITLDFNRAFNPPCAFTDLAICPLPPRQNILPFRIEAGELAPQ